jgi:hypothetical protein
MNGSYQRGLAQYGAAPGALIDDFLVLTDPGPPNPFSDSDVGNAAWALIDDGHLPEPDEGDGWAQLLCFILPPGVKSSSTNLGEHSSAHDTDFLDGDDAWWAWGTNDGTLDFVTRVLSHEVAEVITDPMGDGIQVDPRNSTSWHEIGDVCASTGRLNGVLVSSYWSQQAQACVIPQAWNTVGQSTDAIVAGGWGMIALQLGTGVPFHYLGTPSSWEQVGAPAAQFAITNDALYGLAGDRQKIWQYTGHGQEWFQVGGPADSIVAKSWPTGTFYTRSLPGRLPSSSSFLTSGKAMPVSTARSRIPVTRSAEIEVSDLDPARRASHRAARDSLGSDSCQTGPMPCQQSKFIRPGGSRRGNLSNGVGPCPGSATRTQ